MVQRAVRATLLGVLGLAAIVETLAWAVAIVDQAGGGDRTALVLGGSMLGLLAGSILHAALHELGHLLVARMMRLEVLGVRLWRFQLGAPGGRLARSSGHVLVDLRRPGRALPARMVGFTLAGPLTNLAAATATALVVAADSLPLEMRVVAVGLTVAGVLGAIVNLVPHRLTGTVANDGLAVLRWTFRPAQELARSRGRIDPGRRDRRPTISRGASRR